MARANCNRGIHRNQPSRNEGLTNNAQDEYNGSTLVEMNEKFNIYFSIRSPMESAKDELSNKLSLIASMFKAKYVLDNTIQDGITMKVQNLENNMLILLKKQKESL